MSDTDEVIEDIRLQGHKVTAIRSFIINLLAKVGKPLSAFDIQKELSANLKKVNKTTVYRELKFLSDQRIVTAVEFGDGKKRYEIANLPHHHHAVCLKCHKVEDVVVDDNLNKIEKKVYKAKNFTITSHNLEFFGLCKQCV